MEAPTTGTAHCIGRFQFTLPDTYAVAGRRQSIYEVQVSTDPLPPGGLDALWAGRLARIERQRAPTEATEPLIRRFELVPGVPAAWYYRNPQRAALVALEAVKAVGDHAVIANRGADLNIAERKVLLKSGDAIVERLVKNVLSYYAPSTQKGFCIGRGAIVTAKPARAEDTEIKFAHRSASNVGIRLETMTVAAPDTRTYSNLDEEKQTSGPGTRIDVLREQERVAARLSGKEIRVAVAPGKEPPFVRFTWHFAGLPSRGDQPSINIVGTALQRDQALLEKAWETLLSSLQPVPI